MSTQINTFNSLFFLQPIDQQYSKKENMNVESMLDLLNISTDSETDSVVTTKPIFMKDLLINRPIYKIKITNYLKYDWKQHMYIHKLKSYKKCSIVLNKINSTTVRML